MPHHAVTVMSDFICGANEKDMHFTGVNWERDVPLPSSLPTSAMWLKEIPHRMEKEPSPFSVVSKSDHVFQLGTRYSEDMNATYLDENGKPQLMQMGCYGIGSNPDCRCGN